MQHTSGPYDLEKKVGGAGPSAKVIVGRTRVELHDE